MTFDAQPVTRLARIVSVLMRPMVNMCRKEMQKDLDGLTRSLEESGT